MTAILAIMMAVMMMTDARTLVVLGCASGENDVCPEAQTMSEREEREIERKTD